MIFSFFLSSFLKDWLLFAFGLQVSECLVTLRRDTFQDKSASVTNVFCPSHRVTRSKKAVQKQQCLRKQPFLKKGHKDSGLNNHLPLLVKR
jgi:hypothetical protein